MADKIVEALWDCPYCGAKGIRGLKKTCPNCGHAQDSGTKFYLGEAITYLSEEQSKEYGKGADWTCAYCGSLNRHDAESCSNCGAPREESSGDYFDNLKEQKAKEERTKKEIEHVSAPAAKTATRTKSPFRFVLLALALILVFSLVRTMTPKQVTGRVESLPWQRTVEIEQQVTVRETGWSVPDGGNVVSTSKEIKEYRRVLDHYETVEVEHSRDVLDHYDTEVYYKDNGDGTYTEKEDEVPVYVTEYYTTWEKEPVYRQEPVYAKFYTYDIKRWNPGRTEYASGNGDEPYWPELKLEKNERQGTSYESFAIVLNIDGRKSTVPCSRAFQELFSIGEEVEVTVTAGNVAALNGNSVR